MGGRGREGNVNIETSVGVWGTTWRDTARAYIALTKPRVMMLLLITTVAALLIAAREQGPSILPALPHLLLWTMIGGALASGGASTINQYIDRDIDGLMARTKRRPLPAGALSTRQVLVFGILLSIAAVVLLALFVNPLAAGLALAGNLFYVFVYTLWLKRSTPQNIVIGGAAGAVPPMVGWAAVTGHLSLAPVLLFVIITYWTPPHFWALALVKKNDYARAAVPMLPVVRGDEETRWHIMLYTLLLVAATLLLYMVHAMGWVYLASALVLGALFILEAVRLLHSPSLAQARHLFMYSNMYLALLFAAMVVDRLLLA